MASDPIARLQSDWAAEVPDLDTAAMATVARLNRAGGLLRKRIQARLTALGASTGDFDVLSALRRQGPPHQMKPSELARAIMLSPSGMTHRIDQLEASGLVERVPDPDSRRTAPVGLTDAGHEAAEWLARELVAVENQMIGVLSANQRRQLDRLLTHLINGLEASKETP